MRKGLLDELRDTSLEVVAALAESYQQGQSQSGRPCGPDAQAEGRGDFLYDVVRLQLTHLNELARLGAAYSFIPSRILERLYAAGAASPRQADDSRSSLQEPPPPRRGQAARVLRIDASPGDKVSFPITLRNSCRGEQTVHVRAPVFKEAASLKEVSMLVVTLTIDGKPYDDKVGFTLKDTARLVVNVAVDRCLSPRLELQGRVNVLFSDAEPQSCCLQLCTLD